MINKAIIFAAEKEKGKFDRYSGSPRILHVVEAVKIIHDMTSDENIIAAAAIHSAMEDGDITLDEVREAVGEKIVSYLIPEDYTKTWVERKTELIDFLCQRATEAQKKIVLANELASLRSLEHDYDNIGDQLWERLGIGNKEDVGQVYMGFIEAFTGLNQFMKFYDYKFTAYGLFKKKTFMDRLKIFLDIDSVYMERR